MTKKNKPPAPPEDLLQLLAGIIPDFRKLPESWLKENPPLPLKRMMRRLMEIPLEYLESGRSLDSPPSFNEALIASLILIGIRISK